MLGLRFCARAFSSCWEQGPLFIAVHGPLTVTASLVAEHRLQTRRLSSCGSRAQLLRGMWDLPRPGPEPASPAPAGRLPTTAPPGKPRSFFLKKLCRWWPYFFDSGWSSITRFLWLFFLRNMLRDFFRKESVMNPQIHMEPAFDRVGHGKGVSE